MTEPVITVTALAKLKDMIGGSTDDLAELVSDFATTLPDQLSQMQTAVAHSDWAGLRIAVHSCKSNSRDLGALHLAELCAALELECKDGAPDDPATKLTAISAAADAAQAALGALDLADV